MMLGLNARRRSAFLSTVLVMLMFAACILPSFAERHIHIDGVNPSAAYYNSSVHIYGGEATPKSVIAAMLNGPVDQSVIVGNTTSPWIIMGPSNLTLGMTFADEYGDWTITFPTPNVIPGHYRVYVLDNESLTSDVTDFQILMNVTFIPVLPGLNVTDPWSTNITGMPLLFYLNGTVVPSSGPPGTVVTMPGQSASGGEITVYFDNLQVATVIGQYGEWQTSFAIPNVSVGTHTVRAIDNGGRWMSITPFYVTSPVIDVSIFSLSLFGLLAIAVISAAVLFMFLVTSCRKRKRRNS